MIRKYILYFLFAWPFIWENARADLRVDPWRCIFKLPEVVKYFDVLLILLLFLMIVLKYLPFNLRLKRDRFFNREFQIVLIAFVVSIISWIFNGMVENNITSARYIEYISKFFRPLQIFLITYFYYDVTDDKMLVNLLKIGLIFTIPSLLVAIYQVLKGVKVDSVTGIVRNGHMLVLQMIYFGSLLFFYTLFTKKKKYWILILVILIVIVAAAYRKAFFVFLVSIPFYIYFVYSKEKTKINRYVFGAVGLYLIIYVVFKWVSIKPPQFITMIDEYKFQLIRVPLYLSYYKIPNVFVQYPKLLFVGFGPGNLATQTSPVYDAAYFKFTGIIGGMTRIENFSMRHPSSASVDIIYDFGILVFILFVIFFITLFAKSVRTIRTLKKDVLSTILEGSMFYLLFWLIFVTFLPSRNGFVDSLPSVQLMMLMAIVLKISGYKKTITTSTDEEE